MKVNTVAVFGHTADRISDEAREEFRRRRRRQVLFVVIRVEDEEEEERTTYKRTRTKRTEEGEQEGERDTCALIMLRLFRKEHKQVRR